MMACHHGKRKGSWETGHYLLVADGCCLLLSDSGDEDFDIPLHLNCCPHQPGGQVLENLEESVARRRWSLKERDIEWNICLHQVGVNGDHARLLEP